MQQLAIIIAFVCVYDKSSYQKAEIKLASDGMSMAHVLGTLRDHVQTLREALVEQEEQSESGSGSSSNGSGSSSLSAAAAQEKEEARGFVQLLTEWCAVLATTLDTQW